MSEEKLLGVKCIVRQSNIYETLRLLEVAKAGNVEVYPIASMLMLPPPAASKQLMKKNGRKRQGVVGPKVRAVMGLKVKRGITEIAREIGEKPQSVNSAVTVLVQKGIVKRVGFGIYMRVKPDQMAEAA